MVSERARKGGGREVAIPAPTVKFSYGIGSTYGATGDGAAWFGPGQPMTPQAPPEVAGRRFDFPQGYNINTQPRAYEPITFAHLRAFGDAYDLLRLVIETRKDQMERLRWVIQLKDSKEKLTPQKKNKIKELTKFFKKPDGENRWNAWLRIVLEDLFVIDAVSLHRRRTRGGKLIALDPIDGATVKRILDDWGRTPEDPFDTAYQQVLKGMPAVNYGTRDLMYRPRNVRVHKVYGFSPVEQILMTINIALRRQVFQLNFFTEGNMPPALIGVPETWTPDQIRTFQEWFDNILAGNLAERSKARFVPNAVGKTYIPTQETELFGAAEEWLARVTCFAFSVNPQPFIKMMNRATSENASQNAAAEGLTPIQNYIKDLVDTTLEEDLDADDYEFIWKGDDELDPTKRQAITEADVKVGLLTVNEGRVANGRDPYEDPQFDEPMFMTSNGLAPLVLTVDAQGGAKVDENGNPINPDPNTPQGKDGKGINVQPGGAGGSPLPTPKADKTDEGAAAKVAAANLMKLVEQGDVAALSRFLQSMGPAPTEENDHE